jgi:hypothetical protein
MQLACIFLPFLKKAGSRKPDKINPRSLKCRIAASKLYWGEDGARVPVRRPIVGVINRSLTTTADL